ncbi:hypothetical protein IWX49DRAFT_602025, partial [Phyllosticta citricarpa]
PFLKRSNEYTRISTLPQLQLQPQDRQNVFLRFCSSNQPGQQERPDELHEARPWQSDRRRDQAASGAQRAQHNQPNCKSSHRRARHHDLAGRLLPGRIYQQAAAVRHPVHRSRAGEAAPARSSQAPATRRAPQTPSPPCKRSPADRPEHGGPRAERTPPARRRNRGCAPEREWRRLGNGRRLADIQEVQEVQKKDPWWQKTQAASQGPDGLGDAELGDHDGECGSQAQEEGRDARGGGGGGGRSGVEEGQGRSQPQRPGSRASRRLPWCDSSRPWHWLGLRFQTSTCRRERHWGIGHL